MPRRTAVPVIAGGASGLAVVVSLFVSSFVRFNYPNAARYPVRGVDVSHHQGRIDWVKLRDEVMHLPSSTRPKARIITIRFSLRTGSPPAARGLAGEVLGLLEK